MDVNDYGVSIHGQFGLRRGQLAAAGQDRNEHTLKIWRIALRSNFQAAIATASFFA